MKPRHARSLALALAATLFAPAALADRGHHSQQRSGVVIYLGSHHKPGFHHSRPWRPPHGQAHSNSYRQGFYDGYRAGQKAPKRQPHHKGPHWRPGHMHAGPPGHIHPAPGRILHSHR
jgi:hypothetical protein